MKYGIVIKLLMVACVSIVQLTGWEYPKLTFLTLPYQTNIRRVERELYRCRGI